MSIVQRLKDLFRRKPVPDEKLEKLAAANRTKPPLINGGRASGDRPLIANLRRLVAPVRRLFG